MKGLAIIGEYDELERFCRSKKSPIGYEVGNSIPPSVMYIESLK